MKCLLPLCLLGKLWHCHYSAFQWHVLIAAERNLQSTQEINKVGKVVERGKRREVGEGGKRKKVRRKVRRKGRRRRRGERWGEKREEEERTVKRELIVEKVEELVEENVEAEVDVLEEEDEGKEEVEKEGEEEVVREEVVDKVVEGRRRESIEERGIKKRQQRRQ